MCPAIVEGDERQLWVGSIGLDCIFFVTLIFPFDLVGLMVACLFGGSVLDLALVGCTEVGFELD